jgi:catechol 2,3-dioxygenase-like lactoylglutathione lyase family enzyme
MTKLSTIGQIAMVVKDVPRAVTFYCDTLGMRFLFQAPPALAFFDCDGIRLMLTVPEEKEFDHPGSPIYFKVPNSGCVETARRFATSLHAELMESRASCSSRE